MTIGERLKWIRKDYFDMTLEEFGDKLGVKKNTLSTIENNKGNVTDQMRRSVCREFNVNEDWLLNGTGEPFVAKSRNDEITDFVKGLSTDNEDFKAKLVTILSRMTADEWDLLEKMVRRLANLDEEIAPVQQSEAEKAEAEYIKSASEHVPPMAPAASNSTAGDGNGETA